MWTKEQQRVIDFRNGNLLVAAAAGSGKTAVLVQRIIKLITVDKVDIDKLLVVTFTNAAASEMRERISLAVSKELDKNPEDEHLQKQMVLLNKSNITTIHSFCLEVIKTNFHKIKISPGVRIGDTNELNILRQECLEEVFEIYYDKEDEKFFKFVNSYGNKYGDDSIQELILSIYNFTISSPNPKEWLRESKENFVYDCNVDFSDSRYGKILINHIKEKIEDTIFELENLIQKLFSFETSVDYAINRQNEIKLLNEVLLNLDDYDKFYESFNNVDFGSLTAGKRAKDDYEKEIRASVKTVLDSIKDFYKKYIEVLKPKDEIKSEMVYLKDIVEIVESIILDFMEVYEERKVEKNILDFSDMEHFTLHILRDQSVASIYKEKFEEIFIDEYQDSNYVQEEILSLISRNDSNRFMVGDIKQSIYGFRHAKPEIFIKKYKEYSDIDSDKTKVLLHKNFRSREEVISSCNYIFENIMSEKVGDIDYNEDEKLNLGANFIDNNNVDLFIDNQTELKILEIKSSKKEDSDEDSTDEDLSTLEKEAKVISKRITDLMSSNEDGKYQGIFDKELNTYRKIEYRDIVILLRSTKSFAPIIEKELLRKNIPSFVEGSGGFFDAIEIKIIMSLLRVIDNSYQDIYLLSVLKSPIFNFTPDDLADLKIFDRESERKKIKSFYEIIKEYVNESINDNLIEKCKFFLEKLELYKEKSKYMETYEFLWYVYTDSGYLSYISAISDGDRRQANLKILFERANQFEENSFKGIFNFISYIDKLNKTDDKTSNANILGESANVVRIMSMHKSKGLEFPVVICANLSKKFNEMDLNKDIIFNYDLGYGVKYVDYDKKIVSKSISCEALKIRMIEEIISEEMRILYVALTRAKEKLILTGSLKTNDMSKTLNKLIDMSQGSKVSSKKINKYKNFLDWILIPVLKHNDSKEIREKYNLFANVYDMNPNETSKWNLEIMSLNFEEEVKQEEKIQNTVLQNIDLKDSKFINQIKEKLEFKYDFEEHIHQKASISVSEIKKIHMEDEGSINLFESKYISKKPKFLMDKKSRISGAEKGTLVHLVMEKIEFNENIDKEYVINLLDSLVTKNIINEMQKEVLISEYIENILYFFDTELFSRIKNSDFIKKEQVLYSRIELDKVYKNNDKEDIMIRGIMDLYFEENEEIVIVDYKTDKVYDIECIKENYKLQVELYKDSIESLTGKKVKEKYLYLFDKNELISL
ncbi:MAG: helicase-exonuclease AddAB subunit AddA [Peptostreptococcaceae bacterium]